MHILRKLLRTRDNLISNLKKGIFMVNINETLIYHMNGRHHRDREILILNQLIQTNISKTSSSSISNNLKLINLESFL